MIYIKFVRLWMRMVWLSWMWAPVNIVNEYPRAHLLNFVKRENTIYPQIIANYHTWTFTNGRAFGNRDDCIDGFRYHGIVTKDLHQVSTTMKSILTYVNDSWLEHGLS